MAAAIRVALHHGLWPRESASLSNRKDVLRDSLIPTREAAITPPDALLPWSIVSAPQEACMKTLVVTTALVLSLIGGASAQSLNLTGSYRCVAVCQRGFEGGPAFVTQNGAELVLLNEAGRSSRAWPDVYAPATRIWADAWDEGAVYSPDGLVIQFDNGKIWRRELPMPPSAPWPRHRRG
jgi:hypothetical protein